jgi:hypothetical protein
MPGAAKAWVNFNGTGTVAIRTSFNVTSITDNTTGDYTVNFTNALADGNYAVSLSCAVSSTVAGAAAPLVGSVPTASACRLRTYGVTYIGTDCEYVYAAFDR